MNRLRAAQTAFLGELLAEEAPRDAGIAVYRANLLAARHRALAESYPVALRLVGEAFFAEAARLHAGVEPSRSGDLRAYGAGFADFIASYPPAAGLPYLPDVARLEWAVHECRHGPDGVVFDFPGLGRVAPAALAGVRIFVHPAARRVASCHPILAIWEANQEGRDGTPSRDAGPDRVLVRRDGLDPAPVAVSIAEWGLLEAFGRGATLGEAACVLDGGGGELGPALARLASLGAFGGFQAGDG